MKQNIPIKIFSIILLATVMIISGCSKIVTDASSCDKIQDQEKRILCYQDLAL